MPVAEKLPLEAVDPLKAPYFTTRREIGIYNVGGPGVVLLGSKGSVGTEVSAEGSGTLTAAYDFKCILFSAPELKVGDRVDITVGQTETTVTAQ